MSHYYYHPVTAASLSAELELVNPPHPPDLHCASPADYLCLDKAGKAHRLVLQMKLLIQTCMSTLIIGVDCAH